MYSRVSRVLSHCAIHHFIDRGCVEQLSTNPLSCIGVLDGSVMRTSVDGMNGPVGWPIFGSTLRILPLITVLHHNGPAYHAYYGPLVRIWLNSVVSKATMWLVRSGLGL
jgi:hypothetical protein